MNIQTKYEIGQKIIYDISKVGFIKGVEIILRDTYFKIPRISYSIKAVKIDDNIILKTKGCLRKESEISLYEAAL